MEESYETFEEELWPPRADPPPQKPVRQTRRPEMYSTRKMREQEMAPQPPRAEPKTLPRELSIPKTTTLPKALSIENLTQIETPWENVTLNRCLFVAITILVLTSGFQKLHETMRGQGPAEEEETELAVRRPGALRHRGQPPEPETSLWEVMFWWLPDLDDEDGEEEEEDYDDGGEVKKRKSKTKAPASKGLRNKPLLDKKLMKQREGKLRNRRAKKTRDEDTKDKDKDQTEEPDEEPDDDEAEEGEEEEVPKKSVEKKDKKKTQKG